MNWKHQGGRINLRPGMNGTTEVTLTGGRIARQLNDHQIYLICGECREDVLIQRRDGLPFTASDIDEALTTWAHFCVEKS